MDLNNVETIKAEAFSGCKYITGITLSSKVKELDGSAFLRCPDFATVLVDEFNPCLVSVDNVLYNKDMTELIIYPIAKASHEYVIPDTVKTISKY